ncbi:MAG: SAM-dependent methyltransferase [Candidatus Nanopelagicales bacterium]
MPTASSASLPWSTAWRAAADTFYARSAQEPAAHFRTSAHVGPVLGSALARLLLEVDASLGRSDPLDLVDVGTGRGELLASVLAALPPSVGSRLRITAVDVRRRPVGLDPRIRWIDGWAPDAVPRGLRGLLVAHELLDDVPCDVIAVDPDGVPRLVLVDGRGEESLGPPLTDDAAWAAYGLDAPRARAWLSAWWPLAAPADRAELGLARDDLWQSVVAHVDAGIALAVDYGHVRDARPESGSLTAYRSGDVVAAVPDGSCNLTAHVAVDALAHRVGASVVRQRQALHELGVDGVLPDHALSLRDPAAYLDALAAASQAAELLDPAGLGAFWWIRTDV